MTQKNASVIILLQNREGEGPPIKKITIVNKKGGVAKTTTARNMATVLAETYGKKVLLIDLDSSGNLSDSFHCRPDDGCLTGVSAILRDKNEDPNEHIYETGVEGVHIMPSNDTLKSTETAIRLDTVSPQQFKLMAQLKKVDADYDYCIMDCPPSEDIVVINALATSSEVIIPTTVNQDSMSAIIKICKTVSEVQDYNPMLSIRGVLMTRIRSNNVDREGLSIDFGVPKFKTYIRNAIDVERSRFQCQSIREYRADCPAALDYDNFVAEYLGLPPVHAHEPYCAHENSQ